MCRWLIGLVVLLGLCLPSQATYTGLLVTSGGNLYEITSSGALTLVNSSSLGISVGAITQGFQSSSHSDIWALNSAGTDLYLIVLNNASPQVQIQHKGSLGVTGVGLARVGSTLYTLVYNSGNVNYDLYSVSSSTGSASLISSGVAYNTALDLSTDGTHLYYGENAAHFGGLHQFNTDGTNSGVYDDNAYSSMLYVTIGSLAYDGTNFWFLDNSANKLSHATFTNQQIKTVTVTATGVYTYNGMCWGYVPF